MCGEERKIGTISVPGQNDATLQLVLKQKVRDMEFSIIVVAHGTLIRVTMGLLRGEAHAHVINGEAIELEPDLLLGFKAEHVAG